MYTQRQLPQAKETRAERRENKPKPMTARDMDRKIDYFITEVQRLSTWADPDKLYEVQKLALTISTLCTILDYFVQDIEENFQCFETAAYNKSIHAAIEACDTLVTNIQKAYGENKEAHTHSVGRMLQLAELFSDIISGAHSEDFLLQAQSAVRLALKPSVVANHRQVCENICAKHADISAQRFLNLNRCFELARTGTDRFAAKCREAFEAKGIDYHSEIKPYRPKK